MRCNSCSVVLLAGSAPGGRSGRRGQGRAGPQVARLLHRDEFDDHRIRTVILLVRNLEERHDDHRIGVLLPRILHEVVTAGRIIGTSEGLPRDLPEGLADVGWPRILLVRETSQGADNPLALALRVTGSLLALASDVRDKLVFRGRVVDAVAGRLTSRVPVRLLIGPGLIVVGIGLLLMRGLDAGSAWTHLVPGMIVGGVGIGVVNPPLASTAVGVVPPQRAGMASGINSTFRQVGFATGIALLGTLFSSNVKDEVLARVAAVPGLARSGPQIATAVQSGEIRNVIARLPEHARLAVGTITRAAFTTGLNRILLVAAVIALVSGVVSLAAIRGRDFAQQQRLARRADR